MAEDFSKYNGEGTILRKAQNRMLEVLIEVDKICRRNDIPYWIDGGTLLGAVRNGGFIPWDDDLDIGVMRSDYKKLCKILKRELPANLAFQDEHTDTLHALKRAKVRDRNSYVDEGLPRGALKEEGLFIDIFNVESGTLRLKNFIDKRYIRAFRMSRNVYHDKFGRFKSYFSYPLYAFVVWIFRLYSRFQKSDALVYGYGNFTASNPQLYKSYFFPVKEMEFEGHKFLAPANPDAYLKAFYGNYMQIPPEEKRIIHSGKIEIY
jgi:lipopolysaccharide cholinephosphotransferase